MTFRPLNAAAWPHVRTAPVARRQVELREVRGKRIAYDANSMAAVEITDNKLWGKLHDVAWAYECSAKPAPAGEERLQGCELLFSDAAPQFSLPPQLPNPHVVLNLTHACNLDCRYCFTKAYPDVDEGKPLAMDFETAARGIERLAPAHYRHIAFFGGEPMLKFDLMQQIVGRFDESDTTWGMTTNATMIWSQEARWLAEHKFSAIVSLDGPPAIHNANRPMRVGSNSCAATLRGMTALKDAGMGNRITLRGTFRGPGQMLPMVETLNDLCRHGFAKHVSVEPAARSEGCAVEFTRLRLEREGHIRLEVDWDDWQHTVAAYAALCDWLVEEARAGRRAVVHNLSLYLRRLTARTPQCSECGAGRNYYTIAPDGTIHACHRERSQIGHVDYGIDEAARAEWVENRYYARPTCAVCPIRHACGGGCRAQHREHAGNHPAPDVCAYANLWFDCALWLLSELSPEETRWLT